METNPEGAKVAMVSGETCTTPCAIELKRKNDQRVNISMAGYEPTYALLQSKLGGSTFGNILAGGGVGAIVDGSNGASNRLYPNPFIVRLAPTGSDEESMLIGKNGEVVKASRRTTILSGSMWRRRSVRSLPVLKAMIAVGKQTARTP